MSDSRFSRCVVKMGNGQSTSPPQKAANKLSKPRTGSWAPLTSPKFGTRNRCSSQPNITQYNLGTVETIASEVVEQETAGGGQASLLRPMSSHGDISPMDVRTDLNGDYFDTAVGSTMNNSQGVEGEDGVSNSPIRGGGPAKR